MIDRYKLNQFYQGKNSEIQYSTLQEVDSKIYEVENLKIALFPIDFPIATSDKEKKEIQSQWIQTLPVLKNVKSLSVRHRIKQDFFEAICKMENLEQLDFWSSTVEDLSSIGKLAKLKKLSLSSFTRLKDISPLCSLKNLSVLSIQNCFAVENYDVLGKMTQLVGLQLCGDSFAPKNLRLKSLIPLETLTNLKHLDLSTSSVIDKNYESIIALKSLERLDITVRVPMESIEKIKKIHKNLKAGLFMDWDFENQKLYDGKQW